MSASKIILTYNLDSVSTQRLSELTRAGSIRIKKIVPSQYNQPLGRLAEIQGIQSKKNSAARTESLQEPMLIFSGFTSEALDDFLNQCKKENLLTGCLKAILTPSNVFWNSCELYKELLRERRSL